MKTKQKAKVHIPMCKKCGHEIDYHAVGKFARAMSYFFSNIYSRCMVGPWCKCVKFIPRDNLRFLEWLSHDQDKRS